MHYAFRPAREGEHRFLTELAFRSTQVVWDYSDEFMAWEPEAIEVPPSFLSSGIAVVLESDGSPVGFYVLRGEPPKMELSRLMVEPEAVGTGCGRRLWEHAVQTARERGVSLITLDADPNAEPFYLRMGAQTVGEHDWEPPMMPGWRVKKMEFRVQES